MESELIGPVPPNPCRLIREETGNLAKKEITSHVPLMFLLSDESKSLRVIKIRFPWLRRQQTQGETSNAGVPAEGVSPEAAERRGVHGAHVELVVQQV